MNYLRLKFGSGAAGRVPKRFLTIGLSVAVLIVFDCVAGIGLSTNNVQAAQFGYMSRVAGGVDNVENPPAMTFNQTTPSASLDVDTLGRLYFEDFGKIKRIELDGTISDFSVGQSVLDFKVVGELLYYVEGDHLIHRYDLVLEQPSKTMNPGVEQASFREIAVGTDNVIYVFGLDIWQSTGRGLYLVNEITEEAKLLGGAEFCWDCEPYEDGTTAQEASFEVWDMAVDPTDNTVVFLDTFINRISRIDPASGLIYIVADDVLEYYETYTFTSALHSIDVRPNGNIVFSDGYSHVYEMARGSSEAKIIAGSGVNGTADDGRAALEAAMEPYQIALDEEGSVFFNSSTWTNVGHRIRRIDSQKDIVSTVIGAPGALSCSSPTDGYLPQSSGIAVDDNEIVYVNVNQAILAIDSNLDTLYSVAGQFGTRGNTDDGESAYGNPLAVDGVTRIAFGPDGALYFTEQNRLRRIHPKTGLLETVAEGQFRWISFNSEGALYAVRQYYVNHLDFIEEGIPDFVQIDVETGKVTVLIPGGEAPFVPGETAVGRDFRGMADFLADSNGKFYVLMTEAWGAEPGIYAIEGPNQTLVGVVTTAVDGWEFDYHYFYRSQSRMALDEKNNFLYFSNVEGNKAGTTLVVRRNLQTAEELWFDGGDGRGGFYRPVSSNSEFFVFNPSSLALAPSSDVYLIDAGEDWQTSYVAGIPADGGKPREFSELLPDDLESGDKLGASVGRSKNWFLVGVPNADKGNGSYGEVLVYYDNDCRPILRDRISAQQTEGFGGKVSFLGLLQMIITAIKEEEGSAGENETQADSLENSGGTVQLNLFGLEDDAWVLQRDLGELLPRSDVGTEVNLAATNSILAVGIPGADNGVGSVTVFNRTDLNNPIVVKPTRSGVSFFGKSVALSGDRLAVGSNSSEAGGVAELFRKSGSSYAFVDAVQSESNTPEFAAALAMNDAALYVGAPTQTGGRVYGYRLENGSLNLVETLSDPVDASNPSFGESLAIEDDVLVAGSPDTATASAQADASFLEAVGRKSHPLTDNASGAVHMFETKDRDGVWQQGEILSSQYAIAAQDYGRALDVNDGRILVGAPETDNGKGVFDSVGDVVQPWELSGLWYDPEFDGEGFNVLVAGHAVVVYYYGYTQDGERLWLISRNIEEEIRYGKTVNIPMLKAVEGEFDDPGAPGEAIVEWGLLSMTFGSQTSATFSLTGWDGSKVSRGVMLVDATSGSEEYSGLWYDPSLDGEGYNVISGAVATVIFYYGSTSDGERLWLISENLDSEISNGETLQGVLYEVNEGDFYHPTSNVEPWGTIEARFDSCSDGRIVLAGDDGSKVSDVVKLAGVAEADCP